MKNSGSTVLGVRIGLHVSSAVSSQPGTGTAGRARQRTTHCQAFSRCWRKAVSGIAGLALRLSSRGAESSGGGGGVLYFLASGSFPSCCARRHRCDRRQ